MRYWMSGLMLLLSCGSSGIQAADAEQFAEELGTFAASATACSSPLAGTIEKCLDEVIQSYGFEGDDKERLLQAYQAGVDKGKKASEEEANMGCGDMLRQIRIEPFWVQCPEQAKHRR